MYKGNTIKITWWSLYDINGYLKVSNDRFVISLDIKFSSFFRTAGLKEEKNDSMASVRQIQKKRKRGKIGILNF